MATAEPTKSNIKRSSKHLFKYTGLDRIQSCVENGVYAANIADLNDPFEYDGIEYPDDYRVACLTNSETKMLMWAYYGNHQNCCIEFAIDYDVVKTGLLKAVDYISEFRDHDEMDNEELIQALYTKGSEWSHEKEWRAVWYKDNEYADGIWKADGDKLFLRAKVVAVTFGLAAIKNPKYQEALQYLLDYNQNHTEKIRIQKCKVSGNKYEIKIDKQFKAKNEVERLKKASNSNNVNIDVRHEVYDFGDEDAVDDSQNSEPEDYDFGDEDADVKSPGEIFIATHEISIKAGVLLVFAAAGDGQILKIQTLGTNPDVSTGGKQFMKDNSNRESAKWQEALYNLVNLGLVKAEGYKDEVFSVTGIGYDVADSLKKKWNIDTQKEPLVELARLEKT